MPGPLQSDKELAASLGRATGAWALLESMLTMLFAVIVKIDLRIAVAIFDFFKSTPTQRDVLVRVAKLMPHVTDTHRAMLADLMTDYQDLAKRRNEIAHNPYGWMDKEQTKAYVMLKVKGAPMPDGFPYTTRTISRDEIEELTRDIDLFRMKLMILRDSIAPLPPLPEKPE